MYDYSSRMDELLIFTKKTLCSVGLALPAICKNYLSPVVNSLSNHINAVNWAFSGESIHFVQTFFSFQSIVPLIKLHTPAGASYKQFSHYVQLIENGRFSKFDYGNAKNLQKYGNSTAPDYPLENCTVPMALFYSDLDTLARTDNVLRLVQALPNVFAVRQVRDDTFNHVDFVWAMDAKDLVYKHVSNLMHVAESTFGK